MLGASEYDYLPDGIAIQQLMQCFLFFCGRHRHLVLSDLGDRHLLWRHRHLLRLIEQEG